jgi:hypothetical protein
VQVYLFDYWQVPVEELIHLVVEAVTVSKPETFSPFGVSEDVVIEH